MRRFAWLATALLMAVAMLVYMRATVPLEPSAPVPQEGLARPAGDREALVAGLFQGALMQAVDREDFAETPGYRRLLYHVRAMPAAEFSARVTGWLDWEDAVAHPERWRGEFVRVRGWVAQLDAVKLHGLDAGIEDVYRGFIFDGGGTEAVVFDSIERPPPVTVDEAARDTLDIEGLFYRTVQYEAEDEGQVVLREVPYLIARTVSVHGTPSSKQSPWIVGLKVLGVGIVSAILALVIARWGAGRSKRGGPDGGAHTGIREMFEARLRAGGERPGDGPQAS